MALLDWIPAISTTGLLGAALWLFRSVISTRLAKSVQHEFDNKLETIRASLRNSEESFKADLRSKETQIIALRSGALAGLVSRQTVLDKRRIEAVDQLWSGITALAPAKAASATMAVINFEAAAQAAAKNPKAREMFAAIAAPFDIQKIQLGNALTARPFVSQFAWAIFSAYQAIVFFAVFQLNMLKIGIDLPKALDTDAVMNLIKVALPDQAEYITKQGAGAFHYLLDLLEFRLLEELKKMLQGDESDKATVEQAAAIVKEAERVMQAISRPAPS